MNESNRESLDPHSLEIFRAVAATSSFTGAGEKSGLTQSAVTRQVRSLEDQLEVRLFERTTRQVRLTEAGRALLELADEILADFDRRISNFRASHGSAPKRIRAGIARSVGFSHFPGFFTAFRHHHPDVELAFSYDHGDSILSLLQEARLDVGICCQRKRLPRGLEVMHEFEDRFTAILPPARQSATDPAKRFENCPLITLSDDSETGKRLSIWIRDMVPNARPSMQIDSFDLAINLVSLGFGASIVPIRALALYGKRKPVDRLKLRNPFTRKLIVVARKDTERPSHLQDFIESILY